jgi:hypothetical protein
MLDDRRKWQLDMARERAASVPVVGIGSLVGVTALLMLSGTLEGALVGALLGGLDGLLLGKLILRR